MNLGKEDEQTEFKIGLGQLDRGIKSLTAMLNRQGFGRVFFGVEDDGTVRGLDIGKTTFMDIRNRIKDLVSPQILAKIEPFKDENGRLYIRVSAVGTDIPYSCDGRYYIRNVSADEKASNTLLRKMLSSGESDLITEIESENQDLTFDALVKILSMNDVHATKTKNFYKNYKFFTSSGKYNLMAFLLSDQNTFSIKVTKFNGMDKSSMSSRTEYGGKCLLVSVSDILAGIKAINHTKVDLSEGKRKEVMLFSFEAFREAWVNACLHNSWSDVVPPSVFVFNDRIEVLSYGGLPYGLSKEDFFEGTSMPVNKALFTIFILSGFAEQSGHGVPIIVNDYGKDAFKIEDKIIKVTIPFTSVEKVIVDDRLSHNQLRVLQYLSSNPQATLNDVADSLDLSISGVKKIINNLKEQGRIERTGSKRYGRWKIN